MADTWAAKINPSLAVAKLSKQAYPDKDSNNGDEAMICGCSPDPWQYPSKTVLKKPGWLD